jgi:hypothetical protein
MRVQVRPAEVEPNGQLRRPPAGTNLRRTMLHILWYTGVLLPLATVLGSLLAAARIREEESREAPARARRR